MEDKKLNDTIFLSFGAGMISWLAILSGLYLFVNMLLNSFLIVIDLNPLLVFWLTHFINLILFFLIIYIIFSWIKKRQMKINIVIKFLKINIVLLIVFQLLQIFVGYFLLGLLLDNYKISFDNYYEKTELGYLISIKALFEFSRYFILVFLVIRNQKFFKYLQKPETSF
jgi:hypothetical protein